MTMEAVDLLVRGARVWTGGRSVPGVDAVAIARGRIVALGSSATLTMSARRTIDAAGATLTPGFTDAHIHLVPWARTQDEADLTGAASWAEVVRRVEAFARDPVNRPMIVGRGWDANGWPDAPGRAPLDAISKERPIVLHSHDYHNVWANAAALRAAGVDGHRADPPGGTIERDAAGAPTGLLRESATRLFEGLESRTPEHDLAALRDGVRRLLAAGITMVHDFEGAETMRMAHRLGADEPRVRILSHVRDAGFESALALGLKSGLGDDWIRIGALKLFADGTLGSRTAALLEPYDGVDSCGEALIPPDALRALVGRAFGAGFSVAIHAIGDRACRNALDAFEAHAAKIPGLALAPRIEHLQLVHPDDLPRFAHLGVAASVQPSHCTSDIPLAERWWKSRLERAYPWRDLVTHGATLAFGSDAPVEPPSPAEGLRAALTRTRPGDDRPFMPRQTLGLDEALTAYTEGPARLANVWPRLGAIGEGAIADLVLWDRDLHAAPPASLGEARPALTVVDGIVRHETMSGAAAHGAAARTRAEVA